MRGSRAGRGPCGAQLSGAHVRLGHALRPDEQPFGRRGNLNLASPWSQTGHPWGPTMSCRLCVEYGRESAGNRRNQRDPIDFKFALDQRKREGLGLDEIHRLIISGSGVRNPDGAQQSPCSTGFFASNTDIHNTPGADTGADKRPGIKPDGSVDGMYRTSGLYRQLRQILRPPLGLGRLSS
jgi:hypothetical protein